MTDQGTFIVLDAIDGAGKSTAIKAIATHLESKQLKLFDLVDFQKQHHRLPELHELQEADVLISAEPTYSFVGMAIRDELLRTGKNHSGKITAEAFSLDRYILFSRIILPFLREKPNRWVIQDRGVITSLAYQTIQDPTITIDWLMSLTGNQLELSRAPNKLFLLQITPAEAMQRLAHRTEKQDQAAFEQSSFQEEVALQYKNPHVLKPYLDAGTHIIEIDANQTPDKVAEQLIKHL